MGTPVVLSDTKVQIWKQFTTDEAFVGEAIGCIIWYKGTNLKAIHNDFLDLFRRFFS